MSEATILWPGASGKEYKYWILPISATFKAEGGNYIFAKQTSPNKWTPVYIGQTENLSQRLQNHNEEACAQRNGATHIHGHTQGDKTARLAEERDLLTKWGTPCNG